MRFAYLVPYLPVTPTSEQLLAMKHYEGVTARRTLCAFGHLVGVVDVI